MRWKLTVAVLSIVVLGLGFGHSALAGPDIPNIPSIPNIPGIEKVIVLTGDHVGPGTLGLDAHIESGRPDGVGDQDIFSDDLRDLTGKVAGRAGSVCLTTSPFEGDPNRPVAQRGANLCTTGYALKDGKITVQGIVTDDDFKSGTIILPIVGGTGKYRGAAGQLEVKFASPFTDPATLTFRLSTLTLPFPR